MTLPLSYYLDNVPGVGAWLRELNERGYMLGSDLVEGPYLQGDADGSVTADTVLRLLEADGAIRRAELRPSHSQRAFSSLGYSAKVSKGKEPATWFAWHPAGDWKHPALSGEPRTQVERCDFCDTGYCWTHKPAVAR